MAAWRLAALMLEFSLDGGIVKVENADVEPLEVGDGRPRPGTLLCVMMARGLLAVLLLLLLTSLRLAGMGVPLKGRGTVMTLLAVSLEKRTVRRGGGGASQHWGRAGRGSAGWHDCDMMFCVF